MNVKILIPTLGLWFLSATGCATYPVLVAEHPVQKNEKARGPEAAETVSGVSVFAEGSLWKENPEVRAKVTPLKVRIINEHDADLGIRYRDFSLVSASGKRYSAIPPLDIKGTISQVRTVQPLFYYRSFYLSPYYSRFYPYFPVYGPFFYDDPFYYDYYFSYWENIDLPTERMLDMALPEGALEKGGEVAGFLYFEKVENETPLEFHMELVDAKSGKMFGTISIPFFVEKK